MDQALIDALLRRAEQADEETGVLLRDAVEALHAAAERENDYRVVLEIIAGRRRPMDPDTGHADLAAAALDAYADQSAKPVLQGEIE